MRDSRYWMSAADLGLFTDLYEITMLQAYWASGMTHSATFSLYFRELPKVRRFMLACGQQHAAQLAVDLRFPKAALDSLAQVGIFRHEFLRWLEDFRFSGNIVAMAEGTPAFPYEPILEVTAPIAEAQLLETLLMNAVHLETVLASKAVRLVLAADGRPVADFGMRRMHGMDAAVQGVRAFRTAGIEGTSDVVGGLHYGLPVRGTMAHSFIQAHDNEVDAFRSFAALYPGTTLLVDTYDLSQAIDNIIALKRELGGKFNIGAIRLDSGDLEELASSARKKLDAADLNEVKIVASGGLDEYRIDALVKAGAPIDAFGVGSALGASTDAPNLDLAYKLTVYDGTPRMKKSTGKASLPGAKQVYRFYDSDGGICSDEITLREEQREARALLTPIVQNGELVAAGTLDPAIAVRHAEQEIRNLPAPLREIAPSDDRAYEVRISPAVRALREQVLNRLKAQE